MEGKHVLFLKISIITKEEGEKIRKEIVLQEEIEVVAKQLEEVELGTKFKHSGLIFSVGSLTAGGIEEPANEAANIDKSILEKAAQFMGSKGFVAGGACCLYSYFDNISNSVRS